MDFRTKLLRAENDKLFENTGQSRLPTVKNKNPENNIFLSTFHSFNTRTHTNFNKISYGNLKSSMGSSQGFGVTNTDFGKTQNFGETQKTFYTHTNTSLDEANLDDAKKLLGCYLVRNSDFDLVTEETKNELFQKYNINSYCKQDHNTLKEGISYK